MRAPPPKFYYLPSLFPYPTLFRSRTGGVRWGDGAFEAGGVVIMVKKSKTDQRAKGKKVRLGGLPGGGALPIEEG